MPLTQDLPIDPQVLRQVSLTYRLQATVVQAWRLLMFR